MGNLKPVALYSTDKGSIFEKKLAFSYLSGYILHMLEIKQTDEFRNWMKKLRDIRVNTLIAKRLERIVLGNFGDHKRIDSKILELRIDYGPGYRVYYMNTGKEIILLLIGGDKSSQKSDIKRAKELANEIGGKYD